MITATCHCGAVEISIPRRPRTVTSCNCSICRKYGVLWAYYKAETVHRKAKRGALQSYIWGRKELRFMRCSFCGCIINWERVMPGPQSRMGVNTRLFDPDQLGAVKVRLCDGASWAVE
jgi:hypothetical protein